MYKRKEGQILAIVFSEFHLVEGPKITYQVPEDFISKEHFDAVSGYIIPNRNIMRRVITVNTMGFKIIGHPVTIDHEKYHRNELIFNICFVFDYSARTIQYEPVVQKLSECLVIMEKENQFLSLEEKKCKVPGILDRLLNELNSEKFSCIRIDDVITLHLKVIDISSCPENLSDHDVPVFIIDPQKLDLDGWDLTTKRLVPYINGINHITKIAEATDVVIAAVKLCIQNLQHYKAVGVIPVFQYSNIYSVTPNIRNLYINETLQQEAINFAALKGRLSKPLIKDVIKFLFALQPGTTVRNLCIRMNCRSLGFSARRLVQFGLLNKLIRRINHYPLYTGDAKFLERDNIARLFNLKYCYDDICCICKITPDELDKIVEDIPNTIVIMK